MIGAQDCSDKESGAYTGEVSPSMLKDVGAQSVILGHSERRQYQEESNKLISKFYKLLKGKIEIIGVGGVDSGESAYRKFLAGASYIQLYTGMVYKGPGIVKEIKKDLISILKKENLENVSEAVGINA